MTMRSSRNRITNRNHYHQSRPTTNMTNTTNPRRPPSPTMHEESPYVAGYAAATPTHRGLSWYLPVVGICVLTCLMLFAVVKSMIQRMDKQHNNPNNREPPPLDDVEEVRSVAPTVTSDDDDDEPNAD